MVHFLLMHVGKQTATEIHSSSEGYAHLIIFYKNQSLPTYISACILTNKR